MNKASRLKTPQWTGRYSECAWSTADGAKVQARCWSVPRPRAQVLIIHGMGDHSGRFESLAGFLNQNEFTVMAPDLRGHGRSQGQRGYIRNFDALLDDLDLAVEKTTGTGNGEPVFIYGQSMGGLLVVLHALKRKPNIAGLIASSPAFRIVMPAPKWKLAVGKALRHALPRVSLNSGLDIRQLSDVPHEIARAKADRFRHRKITPEAFFGMVESGAWCLESSIPLPAPALLLHGKKDRITDYSATLEFAATRHNCSTRIWDNGLHELHNMSNREEARQVILHFLDHCLSEVHKV